MTRFFTALLLSAALVPLAGCGQKLTPVTGTVTIDGKPVAGASVTFLSEDGKNTASGETDDSGNFTLGTAGKPGAYPGTYKVTVTKYPKVQGGVPNPDQGGKMDKSYEAAMKKEMAGPGGPKTPAPGPKTGGPIMPPGGMMPAPGGVGAPSGPKSELPEIYASLEKTTLSVKVPSDGPVKLELKSK